MDTRYSRRGALRLIAGGTLASVSLLKMTDQTLAGRTWCRSDPLFAIGGCLFDVQVSAPVEMLTSANGPMRVELTVPPGVPTQVLVQDTGFGYGYETSVLASKKYKLGKNSLALRVAVVAPASDSTLPVEVTITSLSEKAGITSLVVAGTANSEIVWSGKIDTILPLESLRAFTG